MGNHPERVEGSICQNNHSVDLWFGSLDLLAGIPELVFNNK